MEILTGATFFAAQLLQKQVGMLRDLVPKAAAIGVLVNPNNLRRQADIQDVHEAARVLGLQFIVAEAGSERDDLDSAFVRFSATSTVQIGHLAGDAFFFVQRERIVALAARHGIPMMYNIRDYVQSGGLMSYGASLPDVYRQAGLYAARIVKGEKPGDLPVVQPTKFDLTINIKTAKALGLDVPLHIQQLADEVMDRSPPTLLAHSCPGRVRRHVRSWRKPTPHSSGDHRGRVVERRALHHRGHELGVEKLFRQPGPPHCGCGRSGRMKLFFTAAVARAANAKFVR